jgi:hypothetical protein
MFSSPEVCAVLDKLSERHDGKVFHLGCEQLRNPRVSNLRFRPIPKHLAGTPIIFTAEEGTGGKGAGCLNKLEVPTKLLRCSRDKLSNVIVTAEAGVAKK